MLVENTTIWLTSGKMFITTHSLKCWEIGPLVIILRYLMKSYLGLHLSASCHQFRHTHHVGAWCAFKKIQTITILTQILSFGIKASLYFFGGGVGKVSIISERPILKKSFDLSAHLCSYPNYFLHTFLAYFSHFFLISGRLSDQMLIRFCNSPIFRLAILKGPDPFIGKAWKGIGLIFMPLTF